MAKIGVITFSETKDNYGQVLQYLAIHEYLKQRGHEPYLLRYQAKKRSIIRRILSKIYHYNFISSTKQTPKKNSDLMELYAKWTEWSERNDIIHPRCFEIFRKRFFNIKTIVGFRDRQILELDAYAIGSDQIWSYVSNWNFLGFVPKGKPRFSIAPSTGNKCFTSEQIQNASMMLKDFSFVTCREDSGLVFCRQAGYENAVKLLDPTFLIDKETYDSYVHNSEKSVKPYIFVYLLGAECDVPVENIFEFAKKNALEVRYVASQGREDSFEKQWATVPEWLSLMKDARYVITNSFHGMALSIIYQKQFLVLPVIGVSSFMNERIRSLGEILMLNDRIYKNSLDEILKDVDYGKAKSIIATNKGVLDSKLKAINF